MSQRAQSFRRVHRISEQPRGALARLWFGATPLQIRWHGPLSLFGGHATIASLSYDKCDTAASGESTVLPGIRLPPSTSQAQRAELTLDIRRSR
jgi:hypothetical protein